MSLKSKISLVTKLIVSIAIMHFTVSCAKYVTPGAGVNLDAINTQSIKESFETKPASPFPARIAVARIQQSGYYSHGNESYGEGNFSIVTSRDVEEDAHFAKLASLPDVAGLTTLNRLLLPSKLENIKDLRTAAASLHADMLFLYTLDTSFRIKGKSYGPLSLITLGFLPNKEAYVTTTASAVVYDVRTGYVYGMAEQTHKTSHKASMWSTAQAIDNARLETEKKSFDKLINEFSDVWIGILKEYKK
jgi:hypothetical protein